jgi:zinc protease
VRGIAAFLGILSLASPRTVVAQTGPPPPLAADDFEFPAFSLRTLANGSELIVVTDHEQPFVTVNLVIRGGTSADPPRRAGLASLTAELLTGGIQGQRAEQVAEDLDALGVQLGATASPDYITVSMGSVSDQLDQALAIMADVVIRPAFPADRLAGLVARAQEALRLQSSSPVFHASRAFVRAIYGEHPYATMESPETLGRIDVQAVTRFHRDYFVPNNAIFVVAGDVEPDEMAARLDLLFDDWQAAQVSLPTYFGRPDRTAPEIVLVHVPGSPGAIIRAGHAVMTGSDPDWTALRVANHVLGEGRPSRLQGGRDREAGLPGAATALTRRKDAGYFQARVEVPAAQASTAIATLLAEIERLRSELPSRGELAAVQGSLTGAFPLGLETPQQVANQVTSYLLLGVERGALETYRERVSALSPEDVREAAERRLRPEEMVIVVAGEAPRLYDDLSALASVTLLDLEGRALALDDVLPERLAGTYDATGLVPMSWEFQVRAQDFPAGIVQRRLTVGEEPGTLHFESDGDLGPRKVHRQVTFRASTFEAVRAEDRLRIQGRELVSSLELNGGRITGFVRGPGGQQPVEGDAPASALLGEMSELVLWVLDLEELDERSVSVVGQDGRLGTVTLRSRGEREVRVPAGVFDTYEVEVEGGGQRQRIYVRQERPRYTVKIELVGQPVETVLTHVVEGSPDR